MYLSQLKIEGFKSYTEPVEVNFDQKISVIIGSNGVGKSNALDAVIWALGENNFLSLRCEGYNDLIFSGSNKAYATSEADVQLTFEENDEIFSIARTINESGSEKFLVSGQSVSDLNQYREALRDLGLGNARINLVRQDELTNFFSWGSNDRKRYVENFITTQESLQEVNERFAEYLDALMPGTSGQLFYDQSADCVDIEVVFPDKGRRRGIQLSGGERASTALALKLALFHTRPSPMYMFDEIEASLDWTHGHNMQDLLKKLSQDRQLIIVTHFQSTIRMANTVIRPDGSSWLKFHFIMDERLFKIYKCC
ncbi:MAG: AAA family ATPase [Deltaproteobacteria bacterium]|nr:AAA family ATPase [Deltaproteobacteria bacterium]